MKKFLLLCFSLLATTKIFAFVVDDVNYQIVSSSDKTCTIGNNRSYQGDPVLKIPATVTNPDDNQEYRVVSVNDDAFHGSDIEITHLDLSESTYLETIGDRAFQYCRKLASIDFSGCSSLIYIGTTAFEYIDALTEVDFTGCTSLERIGVSCFRMDINITKVTMPQGTALKKLHHSVFYGCNLQGTVDFTPCEGLEEIEYHQFSYNDDLECVLLPKSLKRVSGALFRDCIGLTTVVCYAGEPPLTSENHLFSPMTTSGTLYVPAESIDLYKNHMAWGNAYQILPLDNYSGSGVKAIESIKDNGYCIYDLSGHIIKKSKNDLLPGIYIIKESNGKTSKIIIR